MLLSLLKMMKAAKRERLGKALARWEDEHVIVGYKGNSPVYKKIAPTKGLTGEQLRVIRKNQTLKALERNPRASTMIDTSRLIDLW